VKLDQENVAKLPRLLIEPSRGLFQFDVGELWQYRELLYFLVWRDLKVRYKQTLIGAVWAILQPLTSMVIFTIVFGKFAGIPSDGLPYPVFAYTALLPWTFFAQALGRSGNSLVGNSHLISKVYFPRLIIPFAAALTPLVDFSLSFLIMCGMMAWFGITPSWSAVMVLPAFLALSLITALGVSLWLSPLQVRYRDVGYLLPFLSQMWMYASPVVYPVSLVPEKWRLLYSLNPMAGVIEGFRWALLGKESLNFMVIVLSAAFVLALFLSGTVYFNHMERTFADVL
jgi:lipopolysaccharide transport system permease protein